MSLLEQDITRKGQVETVIQLEEGDSKKYNVKAIRNSEIYIKESDSDHLLSLYYLVSWKVYPEEENIWEPALALLHLCKLISTFYRDHPERPIAISPPINSVPPMARPTVKPRAEALSTKQKQGRPTKDSSASKRTKKT